MKISAEQINLIVKMGQQYGATRLILFGGGVERPEDTRDIDLACDGIPGWKLYEFAARLEEELHMPLDIISLNPSNRFTRYVESRGRVLI